MNKQLKIVIICVSVVLLITGSVLALFFIADRKEEPVFQVTDTDKTNKYLSENTKNISECSPKECLYILAYNHKYAESYRTTISGTVKTSITTQTISGAKYKSGAAGLYISRSTSAFKNTANQIFIENDTVLFRNGDPKTDVYDEVAAKYSLNDYLAEYGTDFRELSNYILNDDTIASAELVSAADGVYNFRYEIDLTAGIDAYRLNMYKMGDLSGLPTFYKSTLEVAMTENFMPISVTHIDEYKVKYLVFNPACVSTITETFETLNSDPVVIPDYDYYKSQVDD